MDGLYGIIWENPIEIDDLGVPPFRKPHSYCMLSSFKNNSEPRLQEDELGEDDTIRDLPHFSSADRD